MSPSQLTLHRTGNTLWPEWAKPTNETRTKRKVKMEKKRVYSQMSAMKYKWIKFLCLLIFGFQDIFPRKLKEAKYFTSYRKKMRAN